MAKIATFERAVRKNIGYHSDVWAFGKGGGYPSLRRTAKRQLSKFRRRASQEALRRLGE